MTKEEKVLYRHAPTKEEKVLYRHAPGYTENVKIAKVNLLEHVSILNY